MLRWSALLCSSAIALATPASAREQSSKLDEPYLGVALMLGFAGEVELEAESATAGNLGTTIEGDGSTSGTDLEVSFGGGVQYIHPLHRYFALGGRLAALSWRSEGDGPGGRNLVFDLALVPQLRLPLTAAFELYLSAPIGIALDLLNEIDRSVGAGVASGSIEADAGFGLTFAVLVGARFALANSFGVFSELGYSLHSVSHDIHARGAIGGGGPGLDLTAETDVSWWQIAWNTGVYF